MNPSEWVMMVMVLISISSLTSLIAAKRLFPNVNFTATERSKKDHDGAIDACLIARYGQLNFK